MSLRDENRLRPVRDDQCRCRRCAAPILISTAMRHKGKCTPCSEVPRWIYVFGIHRRTTLFIAVLTIVAGICFHVWNLYDWVFRWRDTFLTHPLIYGFGTALAIFSVVLLGRVIKAGKHAGRRRDTEGPSATEKERLD